MAPRPAGAGAVWYDVDHPGVTEVRSKLFPQREQPVELAQRHRPSTHLDLDACGAWSFDVFVEPVDRDLGVLAEVVVPVEPAGGSLDPVQLFVFEG